MLHHPNQNHQTDFQETFMFLCKQKINFITHFFCLILQKNSSLVILGNLGMASHTHLKQYQETFHLKKPFMLICRQKNQLHPSLFLELLQRYCKPVILGNLSMSGLAHSKQYYQLVENFCVYLQAKKQLHHPCFSGDSAKICKLLILHTLGKPGYIHPK